MPYRDLGTTALFFWIPYYPNCTAPQILGLLFYGSDLEPSVWAQIPPGQDEYSSKEEYLFNFLKLYK